MSSILTRVDANTIGSPDRCTSVRPLKRQKLTSSSPPFNHLNDNANISDYHLNLSQRLHLRELGHYSSKLSWNSRWLDFKHESKLFCSSNDERIVLSQENAPFCIEPLHNEPIAAIGFEGGDMMLVRTDGEKKGRILGRSKSHHANSIFDISVSNDESFIASSSDLCVKVYDFAQNKVVHEFISGNSGSIKQCKFHPTNPSLLLSSTRSGTINLFDIRLADTAMSSPWIESKGRQSDRYTISKCHDIKFGRLRRSNISVTSLAWTGYNDYTAISACEANAKLNFWDLRYLVSKNKQTPSCTVEPSNGASGGHNLGITSVLSDPKENKVWAMSRNGSVYSYYLSAPHLGVVDELVSEDLAVTSFYCKMALINPSKLTDNRISGSYIACGGDKGVVLFSKPTSASTTHSVLLRNGHSKEATGVAFQPFTNSLMSISDDMTMRFWNPNENLYDNLKKQHLGLQPNSPQFDWAGWSEQL